MVFEVKVSNVFSSFCYTEQVPTEVTGVEQPIAYLVQQAHVNVRRTDLTRMRSGSGLHGTPYVTRSGR